MPQRVYLCHQSTAEDSRRCVRPDSHGHGWFDSPNAAAAFVAAASGLQVQFDADGCARTDSDLWWLESDLQLPQ